MTTQKNTITVAKKEIEKAIVNELYKIGVIEFAVCSNIIKKLDLEINKLKSKNISRKITKQLVIKIPL